MHLRADLGEAPVPSRLLSWYVNNEKVSHRVRELETTEVRAMKNGIAKRALCLLLAALVCLAMLPMTALAQFSLGVRGGYNLTKVSLDTKDFKTNRYGFFVGPVAKITLPIVGLGVEAAALYDQRDARIGDDPVTDIKQKSVNFPVHLRYR